VLNTDIDAKLLNCCWWWWSYKLTISNQSWTKIEPWADQKFEP